MPLHPRFAPFDFKQWVEDNQQYLQPPVNNKLLHADSGMIVMVVGGPNTRVDFHDDPVEEWFYQIKGDMMLKIAENGTIYDVPIREGEVFMMPSHTIHAPQRPNEGFGIVVESPRMAGMREAFQWYCFNCGNRVHRVEVPGLTDTSAIVTALPQVYDGFHADIEARTCKECGTLHPGKGKPPEGWVDI
jgi:3-hydroxyanthranilate 3,4-dioxygenase